MKLENVHVFVLLSGKTKQPSLLRNYWALVSIYWNLIYACESTCFENKMAACFSDLKDEESFVIWTRKLSMQFFHHFEQQREGKAVFKSKFSHELQEVKGKCESMTIFTWISSTHK